MADDLQTHPFLEEVLQPAAIGACAADDARLILERDPELDSERGRALRTLLYLFERDAAIRTLGAG